MRIAFGTHGSLRVLLVVVILYFTAQAQTASRKSSILGTWKGTSICTHVEGNDACKDEVVIYSVSDLNSNADSVRFDAKKIVNETVVPMFDLDLGYSNERHQWEAEFRSSRVHIRWSFVVHGNHMSGTCADLPSLLVRRNVSVDRVPSGEPSSPPK